MARATRREFLGWMGRAAAGAGIGRILSLPSGAAFAAGGGAGPASVKKPNLVFFLIDDMGWMDAACYGSRFYRTPGIDRLAAGGMRFTNAYAACPVCSPTRVSIQTGKYPARVNLTNFIPGMKRGKLIPPEYNHYMALEEVTIGEALKEAGYATCFIGKWHLGGEAYFPQHQGYDACVGVAGGMRRFPPYKCPTLPDGPPEEYITDRLTDEALKFIESARDKPFFLFLSHYAVHIPIEAKPADVERWKAAAAALPPPAGPRFLPEGRNQARQVQDHAAYAAMVEGMDQSVVRVMDKLQALGLAENTVVIFMSDNGGLSTAEGSPTSNVPLRAGKGWLYEGGIREPMIVRWPGVTRPGSACDHPITSTDFYPTMLQIAGLPLRPDQHRDGVSIVPLLRGTGAPDRKAIYWHYPHYSNQGGSPGGAVRCGDFKLIEFYEDGRAELYNLKDDMGEKNDLAAKMPDKAAELRKMLHDWLKSVDARMPRPNPDYKPPSTTGPAPDKASRPQSRGEGG